MRERPECRETRERFPDRIDGPVDASVRGHVAQCAACRTEWAAWRDTLTAIRRVGDSPTDPPQGYWENFNARVARRIDATAPSAAARAARPAGGLAPMARAAAVILLAGAALIALIRPAARPADPALAVAEARLERALAGLGALPAEEALRIARYALEGAVGTDDVGSPIHAPANPDWMEAFGSVPAPVMDDFWDPAPEGLDALDETTARALREAMLGDPC